MKPYVVVLGTASASDVDHLSACAQAEGLELKLQPEVPDSLWFQTQPMPVGFISFLACDRRTLLEFFSRIPVGVAQDLPFFQRVEATSLPDTLVALPVFGVFRTPLADIDAWNMFSALQRTGSALDRGRELLGEALKQRSEKSRLISVGMAMSSENDLDQLLTMILRESRSAVNADAGSIYVREQNQPSGGFTNRILFKVAQNDSVDMQEKTREFPIAISETTISGYVALTGKTLNIEDVYRLDSKVPYTWAKGFDKRFGYRTKSMLTVPLKNMAGDVVGILQLMNRKRKHDARLSTYETVDEWVVPFNHSDEEFVLSVSSLAAVSIERVQLYRSIQDLFEGFLGSSAAAIDERDRVTSGHSKRVAGYVMAFVDALNHEQEGPFAEVKFSEQRKRQFKFAAMLHDIGKIGVPEALLTRETRLTDPEMAALRSRGDYIELLMRSNPAGEPMPWTSVEHLRADIQLIDKVNKAGFIPDDDFAALSLLKDKWYLDAGGQKHPLLSEHEFEHLSIRRGNLTGKERDVINSHAQATWRILSKIPWNVELREIPEIASHHHEKLDGSGYPDGLKGEEIPLESKILAVVDIYEALVAQDRPYKRRMTAEKAVEILRAEVKANHLDAQIVEFFVGKGIHKVFLNEAESSAAQKG